MRTMVGLSLSVLMALGSTAACSSDKVDGENKGGSGAVISGGSGGGSGGPSNNGGTAGSGTAGSGTAGSGTAGSGTAGSATTDCPGMPVSCVDAMTAKACNPTTNMVEMIRCKEEFATAGLISNGCVTDATGSGCTLDGGSDATCWDGANGVAACAQLTDEQFINAYLDCFTDMNDVRPLLACVAEHVDPEAMTVDCAAAEAACVPMGEGGAPAGAGGAP